MSRRQGSGWNLLQVLLSAVCLSGCGVRYVLSSAGYQMELLATREPIERVTALGTLSAGEEQRLKIFEEVKTFGATIGLSATHNYGTYARTWDRTMWNLTACPELSLQPRTWWFPIVGSVPYLGFFTKGDVNAWRDRLERAGDEVFVREVGAYSTLGWFRDPVLPAMLRWEEARIAETVSHELAHATLWIPGSVGFNESFASVVGDAAGDAYLVQKFGGTSAEVVAARDANHDARVFQSVLTQLHDDLDALFRDPVRSDDEKRVIKAELYASLEARVAGADLRRKEAWLSRLRSSPWNNPRLSQFHTYNTAEGDFAEILRSCDGNLAVFIDRIRRITRRRGDPFVALREAVEDLHR